MTDMTDAADSNRVSLAYIAEVTPGTIPGSGTPQYMRITGESLDYQINNAVSNEIRADAQVPDTIPTDAAVTGGSNFELSYLTMDDILAAQARSTFSSDLAIVGVSGDITITAAGHITSTTSGKFNAAVVGQYIRTTGFTDPANNGYWRISLKTSGTDITIASISGVTPVNETPAAAAAHIKGSMLRNGVLKPSLTFEKNFQDITQFITYRGCRQDTLDLDFKAGAILTGSHTILGQQGYRGATTKLPGAPTAANTNQVMSASNNIIAIDQAGALSTEFFSDFTISMKNNLRKQMADQSLNIVGVGFGRLSISGKATLYFQDGTDYDKFLANTATSFACQVSDSSGNSYIFSIPRLKYQTGKIVAGGINQDVMVDLTWQSIVDPITGVTFQLDKFAGP